MPETSAFAPNRDGLPSEPGSIRQNRPNALPDWRNLGVLLRTLLGVNLLAALATLAFSHDLAAALLLFIEAAAPLEILLLVNLLLLAALRNLLWRFPYRVGGALVVAQSALLALASAWVWSINEPPRVDALLRAALLAAVVALFLLGYFGLRARALAPNVEIARLAALNARIRPHFLFNSLNTVLSLIRDHPRQAETALEELADLFRALMRDPRELVSLSDEITLGRQYLDLEKRRLGERLNVHWEMREAPMDLLMPPLILQPLLENAVHYGIAPSTTGGEIRVAITRKGEQLEIVIENPLNSAENLGVPRGNQMALSNIRARLALFYDMEARLEHGPRDSLYHVRIELPCRFQPPRN